MKAGHFSAKIPGQLSAEINTVAKDFDDMVEIERDRLAFSHVPFPSHLAVGLRSSLG